MTGGGGTPKTKPTREQLAAMTKAQLVEFAAENGISGVVESMLKDDIIDAILNGWSD